MEKKLMCLVLKKDQTKYANQKSGSFKVSGKPVQKLSI